MATEQAARRYALTRHRAGDYIVPSNDGRTIWRVYRYHEDGTLEQEISRGEYRKITGEFWATATYNRPLRLPGEIPDDFLEWSNWDTCESLLPTKREALASIQWDRP